MASSHSGSGFGQRCDDSKCEGGFTFAGVTMDNGDLAQQYVWIPQPLDVFRFDGVHRNEFEFVFHFVLPPKEICPTKSGASIHIADDVFSTLDCPPVRKI